MTSERVRIGRQIEEAQERIRLLDRQMQREFQTIRELKTLLADDLDTATINNESAPEEKIALFRNLFFGRQDVYAKRWENARKGSSGYQPACGNEWVTGLCAKGTKVKARCYECPNKDLLPLTDEVITSHLMGVDVRGRESVIGIYPLMYDNTCHFLALDFDKVSWEEDSLAFYQTCHNHSVPATRERSRSGFGCHVWIFFSEPIPSALARNLGTMLLQDSLRTRPEIGLESFDRMFPNQDTLPRGGFGNLIALPLQKKARERGNTLFIDESANAYPDQWLHLSTLARLTLAQVKDLLDSHVYSETTSHIPAVSEDRSTYPKEIALELGRGITLRDDMPNTLKADLIALASFHNPEFYRRDHLRLSTHNTPRYISCVELEEDAITLPRGSLENVVSLLKEREISCSVRDMRKTGQQIDIPFLGTLTMEQELATESLLLHDTGTLSAGTGFGKTVVALAILARRGVNTLILVNTKTLLTQWLARIQSFLSVDSCQVGQIGGGKARPSGIIDVAMIQSLYRKGKCSPILSDYGQIIVDECHHVPARSFERVMQSFEGRYVLGLSATVARKDGHQPIIFMQCGPIRHKVDPRRQAQMRPFRHRAIVRPTQFVLPSGFPEDNFKIHELYQALIEDSERNEMILRDVLEAIRERRCPLILTERREHLKWLAEHLEGMLEHTIVLHGGMGVKQRRLVQEKLESISVHEERVIISTGRYLGEGFDDARLDTLFLTLPIAWKGRLHQYVGRLHRERALKSEVRVYDYVDYGIPVLARMFDKREIGYKSIGYELVNPR